MGYQNLKTLYYKKYNIEEELGKRIENPCTLITKLMVITVVKGEKRSLEKYRVFCLPIKEILYLQEQVFANM